MQTFDLENLILGHGGHSTRAEGVCLMEAVAWAAGEDHGHMPACVSPFLRTFGIRLNDRLPQEDRQKLKAFIPDLIGTADDGHDEARKYVAINWLIRIRTPNMLERSGLTAEAESLRGLAVVVDEETRKSARVVTADVRRNAYAAYAAAAAADVAYAYADAYAEDVAYADDAGVRQSVIDLYAEMIRVGR